MYFGALIVLWSPANLSPIPWPQRYRTFVSSLVAQAEQRREVARHRSADEYTVYALMLVIGSSTAP